MNVAVKYDKFPLFTLRIQSPARTNLPSELVILNVLDLIPVSERGISKELILPVTVNVSTPGLFFPPSLLTEAAATSNGIYY